MQCAQTIFRKETILYLLFTDETNQQPSQKSKFFIYGGVFIPADKLEELHILIEQVRQNNGFLPGDEFKFDTRSRPKRVTREQLTIAKNAVLEGSAQLGVRFTACLVLHQIARKDSKEKLIRQGANTVLSAFHRFLEEKNTTGICMMDRLPFGRDYQYLQEKFQRGLTFPDGHCQRLDRIPLFASTCQGASHGSSVIDIVLGAFRYCVNERARDIAPRAMFPVIIRMMWHRRKGDTLYLREYGLLFRPKEVIVEDYELEYNELTEHFKRLLETPTETT